MRTSITYNTYPWPWQNLIVFLDWTWSIFMYTNTMQSHAHVCIDIHWHLFMQSQHTRNCNHTTRNRSQTFLNPWFVHLRWVSVHIFYTWDEPTPKIDFERLSLLNQLCFNKQPPTLTLWLCQLKLVIIHSDSLSLSLNTHLYSICHGFWRLWRASNCVW